MAAAAAAICADGLGSGQAMHDYLITTAQWESASTLTVAASAIGITDTAAFRQCIYAPATKARIDSSIALGERMGIHGTPTFLSLHGSVSGILTAQTVRELR